MKQTIRPASFTRSERRAGALALVALAVLALVHADALSIMTTGTFSTEKLKVTSTAADAIVSSGGAQIGGQTIIAASTTSSATAERLLLKSTNPANDRSSIQWVDDTDTHKWAMGNQIAFDPTEASFFLYDWVNNFYPIILRDGTTAGRRSHFIGGVAADNGGIAYERNTGILSFVINHPGGSGGGGDRLNLDEFSVLKGPDYTQLAWASSSAITDPTDLAIGRSVAGVAEINNGTPGTLRALSASTFYASGGVAGPSWQSGAGSPEGVVTAPIGSTFSRTDGSGTTALYFKGSGAGNTGWLTVGTGTGTITGSGTTNTMAKFTGASSIGDSLVTDDGTTVAVGGTDLTINTSTNTMDWRGGFTTFFPDGSLILGSSGGIPTSVFVVNAVTGDVSMNIGDLTVSGGNIDVGTGQVVINPVGTITASGAITADGGLRVFDVAGAGLTSSTNTVNVIAAANGGITVNADSVQMTFCGANQVPQMNAGGTQWGCGTLGSGTIGGSATAPGVIYASAANTAATEATVFAWYAAEDTLNIGAAAVTNCGAGACDNGLNVTSAGADLPIRSWNSSATGYNGFAWNDSTPAPRGSIGYGNASAGLTAYRNLNFISSDGADYIFGEATTGTVIARIFMTAGSAGIQWANGSSGAVGAANTGKLRYNSTTQTFQASNNGAAFSNIVTGTVAANTLPKSADSTTGALTASAWTDNGTQTAYPGVVRLTASVPTINCPTGTGEAIDAGSTHQFGGITGSSSGETCTVTLNVTGASAPLCKVARDFDGVIAATTETTTTFDFVSGGGNAAYTYWCTWD